MADWKSALATLRPNNKSQEDDKKSGEVEKRKRVGVVYSTNPNYDYQEDEEQEIPTLPKNQQRLRLSVERAGRGGKTVTLIKGFVGTDSDKEALCRLIKQKYGVGGSVNRPSSKNHQNPSDAQGNKKENTSKDNEIVIQGDLRAKLVELLIKEGYTQTK
ncbi:MAG: translation initiation factor [Bacteroidaceae bacterium]